MNIKEPLIRQEFRVNIKMAGKTGTSQVRKISKEERESGVLKMKN